MLLTQVVPASEQVHQRCHFLPRKPGVYAYAAERLIRICMMVMAHSVNWL